MRKRKAFKAILIAGVAIVAIVAAFLPDSGGKLTASWLRSAEVNAQVYSSVVGFVKQGAARDGWTLLSVPFEVFGGSKINEGVGVMLGENMFGAPTLLSADQIHKQLPAGGFEIAFLFQHPNPAHPMNGLWASTPAAQSLMELPPGTAVWALRQNQLLDPAEITFLGKVTDPVAAPTVTIEEGWNMFANPYPVQVHLTSTTIGADGAFGAPTLLSADQIHQQLPAGGFDIAFYFQHVNPAHPMNGKWATTPVAETTINLEPGIGYWYFRQAPQGQLVWTVDGASETP